VTVADKVELRIQATPENVEVFLGERRLGAAPGPIELPRGDSELTLTFSAKGYESKRIAVKPSQSVLIPISLEKSSTTVKPPPTKTGKPPPTTTGKPNEVFYD